ncbi:hypothetical protein KIPE111705_43995 [Kibdelosporangium persicum]|uniref:Glycine-rich protein n=1 Tax=Kibdelosporangium persicum TaxID=2698649 RepID=A0ABX2F5Q0_9PSEU|nr:hypothetical protein [Kibdelosporangium persicum]NRN66120.1 Glycine-rich protein [Kibdelosporangium persicum]
MGGGHGHRVPSPDVNVPGHSHEELANWVKTGEPADAEGLAETWKGWGAGLQEAAQDLMVAVIGSEDGWRGQAANAMREQLRRVAEWSRTTGERFDKASTAFTRQGEAVGSAKTTMPDPVQFSPEQMIKDAAKGGIIDLMMLPHAMYEQHQKKQEAYQMAIQVVTQRDAELAAAAASVPPFEPPPKIGEGGGKEQPPGPGMPGSPGFRPGGPGPGGRNSVGGNVTGGGGSPGGGGAFPGFQSGSGFGPNDPNGDGSGTNDQNTPPNVNIPGMPIGTGTSGYNPGNNMPTNFGGGNPNPFTAGPTAAGGGGGFGNAFGGGFGPGGAPRPGGGFGPLGSGTAAGAGAGAGAASPGAGGMGGARPGAAAGRGGMPGGGMGGAGGRGQGGEDEEHQRPSYLVEPDPDATFGTDQMTAPPVIGG